MATGTTAPAARCCVLCHYGNRIVDAGDDGAKLFSELLNLIEKRLPSMAVEELVDMTERWFARKLQPTMREPLVIDRSALEQHFKNSGRPPAQPSVVS